MYIYILYIDIYIYIHIYYHCFVFGSTNYMNYMINRLYTIDVANPKICDDCRCAVNCML